MHRTNPDSLRSCLYIRVFARTLLPTSLICCLSDSMHQAEIIVVKHLIQGRKNETWVGVQPSS